MKKQYSDDEKRTVRQGYYRRYKEGMPEEKFNSLSTTELNDLYANGLRKLTIGERVKDSMGGIIFGAVVLGILLYSVVTLAIYNSDFNKISKVKACDLIEGLSLQQVLPEQSLSIEETGNSLGAATDCWVRIISGQTEIVAVVYVYPDYTKVYPKATTSSGDWRGNPAGVLNFESNFYKGDVTVFQKTPEIAGTLSQDQQELFTGLAEQIGRYVASNLPENETLDGVRRGVVWGWLMPTFFEDKVQGTEPEGP